MTEKELRIIISGGGTGGHIFPAVSIANAIIELRPDAKILFVGAEGRMEMQRVPDAGYQIIGLPKFQRMIAEKHPPLIVIPFIHIRFSLNIHPIFVLHEINATLPYLPIYS